MSSLRLLLIDDSAADLRLFTEAIADHADVHFTAFQDSVESLAWLRAQPTHMLPHLVVIETHLPKLDGLGWLTAIHAEPHLAGLVILFYAISINDTAFDACHHRQVCGCWQKARDFSGTQVQVDSLVSLWERQGQFGPELCAANPIGSSTHTFL